MRIALNALQGIESALITIEKLCAAFYSDPADRTFHRIPSLWNRSSSTLALGRILKSIGHSGCIVFLLRKFVDHFINFDSDESLSNKPSNSEAKENHNDLPVEGGEHHIRSLVNQAFSVAVRKVLEGYICGVDTLYTSVGLRHSTSTTDLSSHSCFGVGSLRSSVHSEVTLLEVYLHTKELRNQIEAIGHICNISDIALCLSLSALEDLVAKANIEFRNFPTGGNLLTYLYTQLRVADPVHSSVFKFLFLSSCEPYCEFIRSWIYDAKLCDPYNEFLIEFAKHSPSYSPDEAGRCNDIPLAVLREQDGVAVPCFLKDLCIPLLRAGQQLQVVMKLLELCSHIGIGNHAYEDILPRWSDFSSDFPSYASSLPSIKLSIEAMVCARNNYYKSKLEKLDIVFTALEIRYQQVVPQGSAVIYSNTNGRNPNFPISFSKDDSFICPSTSNGYSDMAFDNMESEVASTTDEFSYAEELESSECSSLSGSEEENDSIQLIQFPRNLVAVEQNYLSALNLLSTVAIDNSAQKPSESDISNRMEGDSCEINEKSALEDGSVYPSHRGTKLTKWKPNGSRLSDAKNTDSQCDAGWFLSDIVKSYFYVDRGYRDNGARNVGNMIFPANSLTGETNDEDQLSNRTYLLSNLNSLQQSNHKYHSNLLSMNPVLFKSDLMGKHGVKGSVDRIEPFPCFDFSSVKDPCKFYAKNLSANARHQFGAEVALFPKSNASAALATSKYREKESNNIPSILIDKHEFPHDDFTLESKNEKKEQVVLDNVSGGSGWQSMLSCSDSSVNFSGRDQRNSLAATFEIPLDFVIEKCLLQEILLQYWYVSKLTIKILEEGFDLTGHLLALRRYHFMELADWADLFIMSLLHHKSYVTEGDQKVSDIQGLLEMSVQRSSCEGDHNKDRLFVYMKGKGNGTMPLSTSTIGLDSFDFLGLGYRVDWPISIVVTPRALEIYAQIFSFLIRVKLAVFSLTDLWSSLKDLLHLVNQNRHSEARVPEMRHFNSLITVRHQVNHFVSTLQQYVQSQLSHVSWCRFLDCRKHKVKDMMDLDSVHMGYLTDALHICFLSEEMQSIARIIDRILQCALDFRSCLTGANFEAVLSGSLSGKLSRINISQVIAIKQTFHKNLKELHVCYLNTPTHTEFGLSRFWGYLNYNEYYSDAGNDKVQPTVFWSNGLFHSS